MLPEEKTKELELKTQYFNLPKSCRLKAIMASAARRWKSADDLSMVKAEGEVKSPEGYRQTNIQT